MKPQKPKHILLFKVIGVVGIALAVYGIVLAVTGFGDFESNRFMIGGFLTTFGLFVGGTGLAIGLRPTIAKISVQTMRYIQEENKEELTALADTTADITKGAVAKTVKAASEALDHKIFCKHCGSRIDADSKFCSQCGKKL